MQIKHSLRSCLSLFVLLNFCFVGYAQKLVTYKAINQPLNLVLSKITSMTNVRFAFDDDFLSKLTVSINANEVSVEDFLKQLCSKYPVTYRLIGSTWVIYKEEKRVAVNQKTKVEKKIEQETRVNQENESNDKFEVHEERINEQLPVKSKSEYTVLRLWDLEGTIVDSKTGNRLLNCTFYVDEYTHPKTDDLGFFIDETVGTGEVRALISHKGYYPLDTIFKVTEGKAIIIPLRPLSEAGLSDNVHFTEFPVTIDNRTNSFSLTHCYGTNPGGKEITDYANFFRFVPGINGYTGHSAIEIRGAAYSPDNIQLDGVPLLNRSHFGGQVSAINSDFIHQGFISRGGLGVDQRSNSSGLITLVGKNSFGKPGVNLTATLLDASLTVGIPLSDKISFSAAVRKSIVDKWPNYYYKNLRSDNETVRAVFDVGTIGTVSKVFDNYYDINAKLTYRPNIRNEVNLVFNGGFDDQESDYSITNNNNYFLTTGSKWKSHSLGINWRFVTRNNLDHSFNVSTSFLDQNEWKYSGIKEYVKDGDFASLISSNFSTFSTFNLSWKTGFKTKRFSHLAGAELNYINASYHLKEQYSPFYATSVSYIDSKSNENESTLANLFYQASYNPVNGVELSAGIRGMYDLANNNFYPQPRLQVAITPVNHLNVYYRFGQEVLPLFKSHRYDRFFSMASVWLLPEGSDHLLQSWQHIAGGSYSNGGFLLNVEAFRNVDSGVSAFFPFVKIAGSSDDAIRLINGEGIRQGVDVMLHYQHAIFHHSVSYSLSDFKEKYQLLNANAYFPAMNQFKHRLQVTELVRYSGWIASAMVNVVSGANYLNLSSSGSAISFYQLPLLFNLDLSVRKQFTIGKTNFETGVTLLNVFNSRTPSEVQYYELEGVSKNILLKITKQQPAIAPSFFVSVKLN